MPPESDGVKEVAQNIMKSMLNHVVNLNSNDVPTSPMLTSPLSPFTADITHVAATDATEAPANMLSTRMLFLETASPAPMSEEIGDLLFSQGCDSDGLITECHPEQDLTELEKHSSVEIAACEGDAVPESGPAIAASLFVLIDDSKMKKLKVDETRRE